MNKRLIALLFVVSLCLGLLWSYGRNSGEAPVSSPAETASPVYEAGESPPAPAPEASPSSPLPVSGPEEIKVILREAIIRLSQPPVMDISSSGLEQPELDVKNLYYEILAESPELKYAYELSPSLRGTELQCMVHYMPYKTGQFPQGFEGTEIYSLPQLVEAAEENLGSSPLSLRICLTSLEPDSMDRALQQVGGGYINCGLSSDATALVYSPPLGMDMADCLSALRQAEELADSLVSQLISEDMSQEEKARALYSWLCSHVEYDLRYYSDRAPMPYESQTPLGALRDGCAICGGYANALKLLFEKAGIPCFNVSGIYYGEYHMWNIASLDGRWLWFDATSDRGSDGQYGFLRFALEDLDRDKYQWDESFVQELTDGQADIEIRSPGDPET